jgi:pimeloyl-ACP methyl ester carboxylesterase
MQYTAKSVALATGVEMAYLEFGTPGGLPVVFIHGITDSQRSYERVLGLLPDRVHAFSLTMRGHGDSGKPSKGYAPQDMAADVAAFLDAHKIERAVIVGHSMGSVVARAFVASYAHRALGLVLVGAFSSLHASADVDQVWQEVRKLGDTIPYEFAREFQVSTLATPIPDDFLAMAIAESQKMPGDAFRQAMGALVAHDHTKMGAAYRGPVLIMWGDKDVFCTKEQQDALRDVFKSATFVAYKGIGHALHWEVPTRFAGDLIPWLQQFETQQAA